MSKAAYDSLVKNNLRPFVQTSGKIGGDVKQAADLVHESFMELGKLIQTAAKSDKPKGDELNKYIKPLADSLSKIYEFKDANRASKEKSSLFAIAEGVPALGWVTVPTPVPFIREMTDAASFYWNKVLTENKGDKTRQEWVKGWKALLAALGEFVKEHHTTGLVWADGSGPSAAAKSAAQAVRSTGGSGIVGAFQGLMSGCIQPWVGLCRDIGGDLSEMGNLVNRAYYELGKVMELAEKHQKPSDGGAALFGPLNKAVQAVIAFRDGKRSSKEFNHLSCVSEAIPALMWVGVPDTPGPYAKEMGEAAMFYVNKVLREFKGKDQKHLDWANNWKATNTELVAYIKEFHTTGLAWNPKGTPAPASPPPAGASSPAAASSPKSPKSPSSSGGGGGGGGFLAELAKASDTSKMRKVTADMKTKNMKNKSAVVKASSGGPAKTRTFGGSSKVKKDPVLRKDGPKWKVEYQVGNKNIEITDVSLRTQVYMYGCEDSVVVVKGKVNSVVMDGCKKSAIVFDTAVSSCELVNCTKVQVQCTDKVPTLNIDKSNGVQVYLSANSLDVEIVTAKSGEINVSTPADDGDMAEAALPEQFKTTIDADKRVLKTEPVVHV